MVNGVKCGTHIEKSQKNELRPIDSPINVREEAQEEGLGGVAFPEAGLAHRKQFIYLGGVKEQNPVSL